MQHHIEVCFLLFNNYLFYFLFEMLLSGKGRCQLLWLSCVCMCVCVCVCVCVFYRFPENAVILLCFDVVLFWLATKHALITPLIKTLLFWNHATLKHRRIGKSYWKATIKYTSERDLRSFTASILFSSSLISSLSYTLHNKIYNNWEIRFQFPTT